MGHAILGMFNSGRSQNARRKFGRPCWRSVPGGRLAAQEAKDAPYEAMVPERPVTSRGICRLGR
jgi:hypothetical protein